MRLEILLTRALGSKKLFSQTQISSIERQLKTQRGATAAIAPAIVFLSLATASQAATIALEPGEWQQLTFPPVGQPALDTFTFDASPTGALLHVTDAGASGDRFSISINGSVVGTTSPAFKGSSCGFDPQACFTSGAVSNGTFAIKSGGLQNIEITTIASAFPRIGGIGFLRADTSFLNLYGDAGARADFISLLNGASQGVRFYEDTTDTTQPFTQLFADVTDKNNLNPFGDLIHQVVSGVNPNKPQKPINLLLGYNWPSVLGGAACVNSSLVQDLNCPGGDYAFQALDLQDIKKLSTIAGFSDTPSSVIAHELVEASGLTYGLPFNKAHTYAIAEQNTVLQDEGRGQRSETIGSRSLPSGLVLNNLYSCGDFKPNCALLKGGKIQDYSSAEILYYKKSETENWTLFPWTEPTGKKGWSIWVVKSLVSGWTFADVKSGILNTGVPWSGRNIDVTLDAIDFAVAPTPTPEPTGVPESSLLSGVFLAALMGLRYSKRSN